MKILKDISENLKRNMTTGNKSKMPSIVVCNGLTLQQFGMFPANDLIELFLAFDRNVLVFTSKNSKESVEIPFERLLYYRYYCQTQSFTDPKKNVVGRAIVGNMLFGATGALIGGLTAKEKKKISNRWYFNLGYIDMYGNPSELVFADLDGIYLYDGSSPQKANQTFEYYVNDIYNHFHGTRTI